MDYVSEARRRDLVCTGRTVWEVGGGQRRRALTTGLLRLSRVDRSWDTPSQHQKVCSIKSSHSWSVHHELDGHLHGARFE